MPSTARPAPRRKQAHRYHHGDLRRALLDAAVQVIQKEGVDGLTLRSIGARLGVSRAALYRHFTDKAALLAAVGAEGFRMLRLETAAAWRPAESPESFAAMAVAYVRFAIRHPSHYQVMFGGYLDREKRDPELAAEGPAAFQVLVDAIVSLQQRGVVVQDDPLQLAQFVWSTVHGVAMLAINGLLTCAGDEDVEAFTRYTASRLSTGLSVKSQ
jgi:AcrR family transcriptional regulator